jgi:hypothetical protein
MIENLRDPVWRLSNLYHIKDAASGRIIPFRPRPEQVEVFEAIHKKGWKRIIILKARRLGMSTCIDVDAADRAAFNSGQQISIIDQTQDDASKKLNGICKVAFDSLPEAIRKRFTISRNNDSAWEVYLLEDSTSAIYAGKNARGGTNQFLHISEWGPIQADDPSRSEEILTGAIPSAEHGIVVVETTWKGGKGGHLWNLVKTALETPEEHKTDKDWRVLFFPWWIDPTYVLPASRPIPEDVKKYLDTLEVELGGPLSPEQRSWYAFQRSQLGIFIFREFPSTIEECFKSPMEGAIYADLLDKQRGKGAIKDFPIDGSALVHTFWDEGSPINTVIWYAQFIGGEIRVIDCDMDMDLTPVERVAFMKRKPFANIYGNHYLTHASEQTETSGKTFEGQLREAGLTGTKIVPRTQDVWTGINELRQIMPRMAFHSTNCERGIEALENYHTRRESSTGLSKDEPVHDWSSHAADALRTLAEANMRGMIAGGSSVIRLAKARRFGAGKVLTGLRGI